MLNLKTFHVNSRFFSDDEVISNEFLELCADILSGMNEFVGMLNDVCMPDDDDSDSEEEEEEEEEDN